MFFGRRGVGVSEMISSRGVAAGAGHGKCREVRGVRKGEGTFLVSRCLGRNRKKKIVKNLG